MLKDIKLPQYLYRYEPCERVRIDCLVHGELWVSKPFHFDDELDCNLRINSPLTYSQTMRIYHDLINKQPTNISPTGLLREPPTLATVNGIQNYANNLFEYYKRRARTVYGILCLSEDPNNPRLWHEYVKDNGYCVEFNTSLYPFNIAKKVDYFPEDEKPTYTLDSILRVEVNVIERLVTSKSDKWSYQNEWRVIVGIGDTKIPCDHNSVEKIYVAKDINQEIKERIENSFGKAEVIAV